MGKMTIYDIAKKAGVSRSTVSRVITNSPDVKPETREKVKKIIDECNFQPSSLARGLALGNIDVIALIIEDIRNPYYSQLTAYIEDILSKNGYMVVLCHCEYDIKKQELYLKTAQQYGFAGVIMTSVIESDEINATLRSLKCPVVLLNRYIKSFEADTVIVDNFNGGYVATRHLIELGHSKIGVLTGPLNSDSSLQRFNGYKSALGSFGIEYSEDFVSIGDLRMETGYEFGLSLIKREKSQRPTAVFAGNDLMAIGIIEAYLKAGMKIPDDLSIVGFDDIPMASIESISLTTVRQPFQKMGEMVAKLIVDRINNKDLENKKIIYSPELILRKTTEALLK